MFSMHRVWEQEVEEFERLVNKELGELEGSQASSSDMEGDGGCS